MKESPLAVMNAIVQGTNIDAGGRKDDREVFFHIKGKNHRFKVHEGCEIPLEIIFINKGAGYAAKWADVLKDYLADPVTGKNYSLLRMGGIEERSFDLLAKEIGPMNEEGEICLEFLAPLPFKPEKGRTHISKSAFIRCFEKRFQDLFGSGISYDGSSDDFAVLPYYWNYTDHRHASGSQPGHVQYIKGCVGNLYIKGCFKDFLPFLILGSELHAGRDFSCSRGYYILHRTLQPYFSRHFPNKKALLSVIHDVIERYDDALPSLSADTGLPFDEESFAETVVGQISEGSYEPVPSTAFLVKKRDGSSRMVEQLRFRDLIVQQYLLKTVYAVFERIFEDVSIGFRKGVSREKAAEVVKGALAEGYRYVIESDIEEFFPTADIGILTGLADHYLPQGDEVVKDLLKKTIRNGYILNGTLHERTRGLAQGSPLSPLLANLYLDSFDEEIGKTGVRMVRYADDFIILTKTREEAEAVLSRTESLLSGIGLKVNREKTSIKDAREGFQFLGLQFEGHDVRTTPEEDFIRLKKPLYVTEPYLFLSLNGDAVDIKKDRAIVETIPLRRISEIMVAEKAVFSTALIARCTEKGIPFTIALNSGYYMTTIRPDSKKYHDISFRHAMKHHSLTDTERLCIAKEFAAGKLLNYIPLFRQRYERDDNLFIAELEHAVNRIQQAADVQAVRGHEGAAAKKIYQKLDSFIKDDAFRLRKRDRHAPDRINALLNFGYYLLFSRINATVRAVGLNPYLGFLHSPEDNYESLVCDMEELFRSRVDRLTLNMINRGVIKKDDFIETRKGADFKRKGIYLKKDAVRKFLNQFEAEMERKNSKNQLSMKESIYVQAAVMKKWAVEDGSLSFHVWKV
jgi:CRISPR-associated protein Cas1